MAKDEINVDDTGLDDLDSILAGLEGDDADVTPPKDAREAVTRVVKSVGTGIADELKNEPVEKVKKFLDGAVPIGVRNEYDFVKETFNDVSKVYEDSAKEIKSNTKQTLDLIKSKMPENSSVKKILDKLSKKLETPEENNYYQGNNNDAVIAETLDSLFKQKDARESTREVISEIKENNKFEAEVSLSNKMINNLQIKNDFDREYTINYYRKSIELKMKTLIVTKELLETSKISYDTFKSQFEAIIKNTSLPDLIKYKNNEQLGETFSQRARDNITDMFYSAATPLATLKKNIISKASNTLENVKSGMSAGLAMGNSADTMSGMAGSVNKGELAGGELAKYTAEFISNFASKKMGENDTIRDKLRKLKLVMADPKEALYDMADSELEKNTLFSRAKARAFRGLGVLSETEEKDKIRIRESAPDEATPFDYRTKNSIVKIIPMLLSKIYGEVRSLRTQEDPEGIHYDYTSGKIEENKNVKTRIKSTVKTALSGVAGSNLDSIISMLDNDEDNKLDDDTKSTFKAAILGYLAKNGSISPMALQKDTFLSNLSDKDKETFSSRYSKVMEKSKDDIGIIDDIKDSLYNIKTNTPFIDKLVEDMYKNGNIEEIQKMGILDYDDNEGIYTVNKDKYTELLDVAIKEMDADKRKEDTGIKSSFGTDVDPEIQEDSIKDIYQEAKNKVFEKMNSKFDLTSKIDNISKKVDDIKHTTTEAFDKASHSTLGENIKQTSMDTINKVKNVKSDDVKQTTMDTINKVRDSVNTGVNKVRDGISTTGKEDINIFDKTNASINDFMKKHDVNSKITKGKEFLLDKTNDVAAKLNVKKPEPIADAQNKLSIPKQENKDLSKFNFVSEENLEAKRETKLSEILGLEKVDVDKMHELYSNSTDKFKGIDFMSWGKSLGYRFVNGNFIKIPEDTRITDLKNKMVEYLDKQASDLTGKASASGKFSGIKKIFGIEPGMSPLQILHGVLKKTREWDRKIMLSIPKALGKIIKLPFQALGKAKDKAKTVINGRNIMNFARVIAGFEPIYKDGEKGKMSDLKEGLDKTRKLDKDILKGTPGFLGKTVGTIGGLFKSGKGKIGDAKNWFTGKPKKEEVKDTVKDTKAKIFGDQDGDGDVDNSWKDRFQNRDKAKEKTETKEKIINLPKKDDSGIGILSMIAGGVGLLLPAIKKVGKGFGIILPVLKKIFGAVGITGTILKKIFMGIGKFGGVFKKGFKGLSTLFTGFASSIVGMVSKLGILGGGAKLLSDVDLDLDKNKVDLDKDGKPKPDLDKDGKPKTTDVDKDGKTKTKVEPDVDKKTKVNTKNPKSIDVDGKKIKNVKNIKKPSSSKILDILKSFNGKIIAKLGPKASVKVIATLGAKVASRLVPFAGLALLAYDATMIMRDMITNNTSFKSAVSRQILGFDLFNDDEPVLDENGNPIKPDEITTDEFVKDSLMDEYLEKSKDGENAEEAEKFRQEYGLSMEDIEKRSQANKDKAAYENSSEYSEAYKKALSGKNALDKSGKSLAESYGEGLDMGGGEFNLAKGKEAMGKIIDKAAEATGMDPNLLKTIAIVESDMNPVAGAKTSSAKGLFQFTKGTWGDVLKKYGSKYGLDQYADVMNPMANALMGGEFLKENMKALSSVKKNPDAVDLYMAHFLGAGGARTFFKADPNEIGAKVLPTAAKSNEPIFFKGGRVPRTIGEIYTLLKDRMAKKAAAYGFKKPEGTVEAANNTNYGTLPPKVTSTTSDPSTAGPSTMDKVATGTPTITPTNESIIAGMNSNSTGLTKKVSTENMTSGFVPPTTSISGTNENIKTASNTDVDFSSANNILKDSLATQISMDSTLKEILVVLNRGGGNAENVVNAPKASNVNNTNLTMPDSVIDMGKKRFTS